MKETKIQFKNPADILNFVDKVNQYPFDMDLKCGDVVVDAKSLLGIMNLGFNHEIKLKIYSDQCDELLNELAYFILN